MVTLNGQLPADSDLSGAILNGQVSGNAEVVEGTSRINGQICGNLVIREGAIAEIYGMISGDLVVQGAATIYGMVNGFVFLDEKAQLRVDPSAHCKLSK